MGKSWLCRLITAVLILVTARACSVARPLGPQEILRRSLAAHGGEKLGSWQTLTVEGTVEMTDGIKYNAAYLLWAKMPGKLRVEHDMTADRGRIFYEYFLNDGVAWSRRNLIPAAADARQLRRWWNQCFGIAYYAEKAESVEARGETQVEYPSGGARPAYVLAVHAGGEPAELCIDKRTFYLLREDSGNIRRLYADFRDFGGTVHPTVIFEITRGKQGESVRPFRIRSVRYDEAIEDWLFAEDMPARK